MIIDNILNSDKYILLHPLFEEAFRFLKTEKLEDLDNKKVSIIENKLIVSIEDCRLKSKDMAKIEVHNKFIDIQTPISGVESFGWKYRELLEQPQHPFNEEKDIQFFQDSPDSIFSMNPGNFVIFYPNDGHAPCIGNGLLKKIVIKISVQC